MGDLTKGFQYAQLSYLFWIASHKTLVSNILVVSEDRGFEKYIFTFKLNLLWETYLLYYYNESCWDFSEGFLAVQFSVVRFLVVVCKRSISGSWEY